MSIPFKRVFSIVAYIFSAFLVVSFFIAISFYYSDVSFNKTDILEIKVGEITSSSSEKMDIMPQADGSFMIEGNLMIRDINKRINWDLPTEGPKTLSGLILETAQSIPNSNVGIQIGNYRLETVLIKDNVVKMAKVEKIQQDIEEDEDL